MPERPMANQKYPGSGAELLVEPHPEQVRHPTVQPDRRSPQW